MNMPTRRRLLPFLAFLIGAVSPASAESPDPASAESTVITSHRMEMEGAGDRNFFYFEGDVEVVGNNLRLLCDRLTVISARAAAANDEAIGEIGAIEEIIARGNVQIHQAGRSAYAGLAEVDPRAGTVTLSEDPRVTDGEVEITGYQFVLHRGDKRFESIPDPNAPADQPARSVVRMGALPDLGFDKDQAEVDLDQRLQDEDTPPPPESAPPPDSPDSEDSPEAPSSQPTPPSDG